MRIAWMGVLLLGTSCLEFEQTFSTPPPPEIREVRALRIAFGDFDGDGTSEIATLNDGIVSPPGWPIDAWDLAAADLDGDGRDELLAATSAGIVVVQDGSSIGISAEVLRIGDLNGDGRDDLVTSGIDGLNVRLAPAFLPTRVGDAATFALGDLDGDRDDELAILDGGSVRIYHGETGLETMLSYADPAALVQVEAAPAPVSEELSQADAPGPFTTIAVGANGRILLGSASGVRLRSPDGSWSDVPSPPVLALLEWEGSTVILDSSETVWILQEGSWVERAREISGIAIAGGDLCLLRYGMSN